MQFCNHSVVSCNTFTYATHSNQAVGRFRSKFLGPVAYRFLNHVKNISAASSNILLEHYT